MCGMNVEHRSISQITVESNISKRFSVSTVLKTYVVFNFKLRAPNISIWGSRRKHRLGYLRT